MAVWTEYRVFGKGLMVRAASQEKAEEFKAKVNALVRQYDIETSERSVLTIETPQVSDGKDGEQLDTWY